VTPSAVELDQIKRDPLHVHILVASKDVATMRCLDCRVENTATYGEIVKWWNRHFSSQDVKASS